MKQKTVKAAAIAAAVLWTGLALNGCGTAYKPIELPAASQEAKPTASASPREALVTKETAAAGQPAGETVYVTGDRVNLRREGASDAPVIGRVNKGTAMKRTEAGSEWSRVEYQGQICYISSQFLSATQPVQETGASETQEAKDTAQKTSDGGNAQGAQNVQAGEVGLNPEWKYADFSKINSGKAVLYKAESNRKNIVVCVNAGHGTKGGSSVKTMCHPDGTPKVTGGTTQAGATTAVAVSGGMQFSDGTAESTVTLAMALKLKEKLLASGYDVLMIRESDDVQLDNIARTVIANNIADCHIAIHWDSTASDKGAFYMSVPGNSSYRNMEPVKSHWEQHNALGESLISGLRQAGIKIFSGGSMEMDLTQTSFSTVPSIDIELGDKASDHSDAALDTLAGGLLAGINQYFGQQ